MRDAAVIRPARRAPISIVSSASSSSRLGGGDIEDVVSSARAELIGLFGLARLRVRERRPPTGALPRLGIHGAIEGAPLVATHTDFLLPPGGVELPVVGRGIDFGRLVLFASESVRASLQKRVVAVAIADQLGITLGLQESR